MPEHRRSSPLNRRQALAGGAAFAALAAVPAHGHAVEPGPCERLYRRWRAAEAEAAALPEGEDVADTVAGKRPAALSYEAPRADGAGTDTVPLLPREIRERFAGAEAERRLAAAREWSESWSAAIAGPEAQAADSRRIAKLREAWSLFAELLRTPAHSSRELAFKVHALTMDGELASWACDALPGPCDSLRTLQADAERLIGEASSRSPRASSSS